MLALAGMALLLPSAPAPAAAQDGAAEYRGAAALGLSLRRLGTTKRVLMVGAHPDDEDTQLLARFALQEGADVAYLSLTRGEGGQNGIGAELGEGLGLLRTEELLAARRVDGAAQFFSRAYDFGYSKSAEEAFRHWPREALTRDVVRVIRQYRPDLVVTVFSGTPRDGHGQHQVSALVALDAVRAAADPAAFADQLAEGLRPWAVSKVYQSYRGNEDGATVRVPIGALDPLIGRSPFQLAMASRSRHRSQDMGRPEMAGPRWGTLRRVMPAPEGMEPSPWAGLDTTLAQAAGGAASSAARALEAYARQAQAARDTYNPLHPEALVAPLAGAVATLRAARAAVAPGDDAADLRRAMDVELAQARAALALASGLVLDAVADDARVAPGQAFTVEVSLWNGGAEAVRVDALAPALPDGWTAEALDTAAMPDQVDAGALLTRRFRVRAPADAAPTDAYFLRAARDGDLYRWPADDAAATLPFGRGPVWAGAAVRVRGEAVPLEAEATYRDVDLRQGELRRPVMVVPAVSVLLDPAVRVLAIRQPRPLDYVVRLASEAQGGIGGTLRLQVPAGWRVEPASVPVRFTEAGQVREVRFTVTAQSTVADGEYPVTAHFQADDGRTFQRGVQFIDYPHVRARPLYREAASQVRAFDVRVPQGLRVGYVTGAGEEGPGFLANLGIEPTLLGADDLAEGDLGRFDVIVSGSRAYEVRADLGAHNQRLLEWVRSGGTLIVQYNKYELVQGNFPPYPLTMARPHGRVTDEAAPVTVLDPAHPAFTTPNRIGAADWEGWVQERGLYFADTWDDAYTPLLEMGDNGDHLRGALLVAPLGEGTYVYTGLAFFRQFPAGVPGAYRLFANLLALGAK